MTASITACPPTSVSSPLSRTGSICMCALRRKNLRIDKGKSSKLQYTAPTDCGAAPRGRAGPPGPSVRTKKSEFPPLNHSHGHPNEDRRKQDVHSHMHPRDGPHQQRCVPVVIYVAHDE